MQLLEVTATPTALFVQQSTLSAVPLLLLQSQLLLLLLNSTLGTVHCKRGFAVVMALQIN
jgi:hypothetical protein